MPKIYTIADLMPSQEEFEKLLTAKISYENAASKTTSERDAWNKKNFNMTPWGIGYSLSKKKHAISCNTAYASAKKAPEEPTAKLLRYFIIAVMLEWSELIEQLKRTLKIWGYTTEDLQQMANDVWKSNAVPQQLINTLMAAQKGNNIKLKEAIEKHDTLNTKLFTKEELLKDRVKDKLLEIVDEFLEDLKSQEIEIKIDDILLIGSNASYNYTKNSDIDLHILANSKKTKYTPDVANALYGAYRTLFNKQLDIKLFDIPLEIFVELEDSARVSNGVYSVKNNKWLKKPVKEDIPDYDKDKLKTLVDKWEARCVDLIADIKADKLQDELKVVKLIEEIYDKLRKKGVAKGEYSEENLAFKELRNKGYLDQLKQSKNDLVSKRLSLEEGMTEQDRREKYNKIYAIAGTPPIIQDNKVFYLYNLKPSSVNTILNNLRNLDFVAEVHAATNGKYDFNNINKLALKQIPDQYFNIQGKLV
jgi:hypothetical protein